MVGVNESGHTVHGGRELAGRRTGKAEHSYVVGPQNSFSLRACRTCVPGPTLWEVLDETRERSNLGSGGWRETAEGAEQLLQGQDLQENRTCHGTEGGGSGVGTWPEHSKGAAMRPPPWSFPRS